MNRTTIALAALLLAGCGGSPAATPVSTTPAPSPSASASPSPTGPVVLTKKAAAARYDEVICPYNKRITTFSDLYVQGYVGDPASDAARKAARKAAKAAEVAANGLMDDGYVWPENVASDVEKVAVGLYESSATLTDISAEGYVWSGEEDLTTGAKSASRVRLRLDLPPRGDCS